jgi:hypothetical protein
LRYVRRLVPILTLLDPGPLSFCPTQPPRSSTITGPGITMTTTITTAMAKTTGVTTTMAMTAPSTSSAATTTTKTEGAVRMPGALVRPGRAASHPRQEPASDRRARVSASRRIRVAARASGASSGAGKTELTLISHST